MFGSLNKFFGIGLNCLWLLTSSCYINTYCNDCGAGDGRRGDIKSYTPQRLTLDMIRDFNISVSELQMLRFHLENGLIMQRVSSQGSSQVTASGAIILNRHRSRNEIVIPHLAQSAQVYAEESLQLLPPRMSYILRIRFASSSSWLTFSPNLNGEFVLEKSFWRSAVQYGSFDYESLHPEIDHYLLVDARLFDGYRSSREVMGTPTSYPAPDPPSPARPLRARRRMRY